VVQKNDKLNAIHANDILRKTTLGCSVPGKYTSYDLDNYRNGHREPKDTSRSMEQSFKPQAKNEYIAVINKKKRAPGEKQMPIKFAGTTTLNNVDSEKTQHDDNSNKQQENNRRYSNNNLYYAVLSNEYDWSKTQGYRRQKTKT
jgi:hypothetical protein